MARILWDTGHQRVGEPLIYAVSPCSRCWLNCSAWHPDAQSSWVVYDTTESEDKNGYISFDKSLSSVARAPNKIRPAPLLLTLVLNNAL